MGETSVLCRYQILTEFQKIQKLINCCAFKISKSWVLIFWH